MRHRSPGALLLLLAIVLGALPARAAEAKRYKFVVITHATAVPFFVPVRKGAEDAGKLVGAEVVYTGPAGFDIQRQVEFMKSAIAQKVDGIACTLPDPSAFNDVVAEARAKGIPVIAINADAPKSERMAYIGQGNYEAGRSMGEQIVKLLPNGGDVLLAIHTAGAENLEARIKGVKDVLDQTGKFKYRVVATGTDLVKAESLIGAALQANPNIKGMFGVEDVTGIAIGHIIEREKLKGKVMGGGFDLVGEILDAIQRGDMQFTIDQQPYLQGFQGVMELYLNKKFAIAPADINTGIAPVTAASVKAVKDLAAKGYR
ncbi:sugar ABC transporter substrate-binding protein [Anaeromyxobacter oryzae]|uniref:Sugar ABC transporter substrate-binding protein n=1 Tax=Anaeromyxobacter oryzae TaxID=2918170 RepID=A0ABM7X0T9_9BACT|nr:sugar ABC transporter substrate-binding protein [Anaeromyxobacter oryzae]BDG05406.1 sugar ABC transporter substrate-binding protein [Anaeromyxobacter oryzae]